MADHKTEDTNITQYIEGSVVPVKREEEINPRYLEALDLDYFNPDIIAPMTYPEQVVSINREPKLNDWDRTGKYPTLPVSYIENRLSEIFGPDNWEFVSRTLVPSILRVDNEGIIYISFGILRVRWANGHITRRSGRGQSTFYFKNMGNPFADSNAWTIAEQEGLKSAAKKLGLLFGRGVKELEDKGLLEQGSAVDGDIIENAIGSRIINMSLLDGKGEAILDTIILGNLIKQYTGENSIAALSPKARKLIGDMIASMPSVQEKAELMKQALKYGISVSWENTYREIKTIVDSKRSEEIDALEL